MGGHHRVLGFETTGVWFRGSDGTDVNSADITVVHGDHGYQERILATGDDRGIVSLFRSPALGGSPRRTGRAQQPRHDGALLEGRVQDVLVRRRGRIRAAVGGHPGGGGTTPAGGADHDAVPKQTMEHEGEDIAAA